MHAAHRSSHLSQIFCDQWTHNWCADRCSRSGWLVTVPDFTPALMSQHSSSVVSVAAAARVHQLGRVLGCWQRWGAAIPANFGQWAPETLCRSPRAEVLGSGTLSIVGVGFFLCPVVGEALKGALGSKPIRMSRPHVQRLTESPWHHGALYLYSSTGEDGQWKLVGQVWE